MFEDEFSALQADMVDICNEYSKGMADKIFIYAANEGMILVQHFYCINCNLYEQVLDILNEDTQKIESVCRKYKQPVPKLMKLMYEPKTKKFNAEYTYENQTSDDVSVFDNYDAWFEEEQRRLEKMQSR